MILHALGRRYGLCFIVINALLHTAHPSWLNKVPHSSLPDGADHVVAACQEDNMFLQCRNRYNKLLIKDVYYGRDNSATCRSKVIDTTKLCDGHTPQLVKEKINVMCSGENKCKVPITPEFLEKQGEEICPEVRKYLRVAYSCHQNPQIHMVCPNGCKNTCWPSCKKSCCTPPVQAVDTISTCSGSCPNTCAPMCTVTCCESKTQKLPSVPTICPGDCPSDCAPTCDESCCKSRKTTVSQFNQPPPTIQYNRMEASSIKCGSMCTSSPCAPTCDPTCCISSPIAVGVAQCPAGCPAQCAPTCQPSCCSASTLAYQQPLSHPSPPLLPPPPPPSCPGGCSQRCAPLCQPTCCQSSQIMQIQSTCPASCPAQCAPLCQPTCCQSGGSLSGAVIPMANPMQTSYSYAQPQVQTPQQPLYRPLALPQQRGCPVNCILSCLPKCPKRCCVAPDPLTRDIQQRQTYRQMLQRFRERQMQQYYIGK